jgi:hypothetical protein
MVAFYSESKQITGRHNYFTILYQKRTGTNRAIVDVPITKREVNRYRYTNKLVQAF